MRMTILQVNLLILAGLLTVLQVVIIYFLNGHLPDMVLEKDIGALAIVFAPTAGIVWSLKQLAFYQRSQDD